MNKICFGIAFAIYLLIMNILWLIICLFMWPFKKEFVYSWRQCTVNLINLHANEARKRNGLPPLPCPKIRKKFKGRPVSRKTFDLLEYEYGWAKSRYNGYLKYAINRNIDKIRMDHDQINYMKPMWEKTDKEEKDVFSKINIRYQFRRYSYPDLTIDKY